MIKFNKKNGYCNAPYSVNISVTERCPIRCPFCFQKYDHFHELDYQKICGYIDELSYLGTAQVQFSGGEPLIYPYLFDSISYAHSKGLYTVISSSGIGMTIDTAEKLKKSGLNCCYISLNGSRIEINKITREGFGDAVHALEILSKVGLKSAINCTAYHENVSDLPQLVSLAKSYDVKHISVIPMKTNNENNIINRIDDNDFRNIIKYCEEFKNYLIMDSCFGKLNITTKRRKIIAEGCRAGTFYMAINASGEFSGCPHFTNKSVNYTTIKEYWNQDKELNRHRKEKLCAYIF